MNSSGEVCVSTSVLVLLIDSSTVLSASFTIVWELFSELLSKLSFSPTSDFSLSWGWVFDLEFLFSSSEFNSSLIFSFVDAFDWTSELFWFSVALWVSELFSSSLLLWLSELIFFADSSFSFVVLVSVTTVKTVSVFVWILSSFSLFLPVLTWGFSGDSTFSFFISFFSCSFFSCSFLVNLSLRPLVWVLSGSFSFISSGFLGVSITTCFSSFFR